MTGFIDAVNDPSHLGTGGTVDTTILMNELDRRSDAEPRTQRPARCSSGSGIMRVGSVLAELCLTAKNFAAGHSWRGTIRKILSGGLAGSALAIAMPAQADYVYMASDWSLSINGGSPISSIRTGYVNNNGYYSVNDLLPYAGGSEGFHTHSFGAFDLPVDLGQVNSVTLNIPTTGLVLSRPYSLTLFDVNAPYSKFTVSYGGTAEGLALFTDLGSGVRYGSFGLAENTPSISLLAIEFNADGLEAIQQAGGGVFLIGGALLHAPIPEPAAWAMMIAGFGLVGSAMRIGARKVQSVAT